jgi:muramidase (phage lysozyme)
MLVQTLLRRGQLFVTVGLLALAACVPGGDEDDEVDEDTAAEESALTDVPAGTELRVTASALNLRASATTSSNIRDVLPEGAIVTCVETSGGNGWVKVENDDGTRGWVSRQYVAIVGNGGGDDGNDGGGSGDTCDPERARGAVGNYQKALHDSLAWAEGTRDHSEDGYDVMFSFRIMNSCNRHPNQCISFGNTCSTAAGRYQFLKGTWDSVKSANGLANFEPESQEVGAKYLVNNVRHVSVPQGRAMTASEFSNAMSKLSWEWASLPPGRYGQPVKSASQMRNMYCSLAGC